MTARSHRYPSTRRLLSTQTTLSINRQNTDPRITTAYWLYKSLADGIYIFHKTTRAGCTTATVAESMNRDESFLVVVPTNAIADETVIEDSLKYSDTVGKTVIHIPSNHACIKNEEMCEQYPDLRKLPILPLADKCIDCEHYSICPVTAIVRPGHHDGIAITYQKLAALMIAMHGRPNTTAEKVIEKISTVKNFIFDEIHEMQYGKSIGIKVYDNEIEKLKQINLSKYFVLVEDFNYLRNIIAQFTMFMEDETTKRTVFEMYFNAESEQYYKYKLSKTINNQYSELGKENKTKAAMATYSELIELTKNHRKYNLHMSDVLDLYKIFCVITSERIVVHAIRDKGHVKVNLVAIDQMFTDMLKSYMMSIQNNPARIILTSATICSHDYGSYFFPGTNVQNKLFGNGGDPMNTNAKMLILADTKKYGSTGRNSTYNKKDEILSNIKAILDRYGDDDCIIIAMSISEAKVLEKDLEAYGKPHNVTYYKAPSMMGVSAKARVMIAVGAAEKPTNAFDAICQTKEDSLTLREEAVHCDTWQAWSRVKDPAGKIPSIVFALGCSYDDCVNATNWGYNRKIVMESYEQKSGYKIDVSCSASITKPIVKKCKDFDNMLTVAESHKQPKYIVSEIKSNYPIYIDIGKFNKNTDTIYLQRDLLRLFVFRDDAYGEQAQDGSYFKVNACISDQLLQNHIDGKITIGVYTLNTENKVRWMCFDVDAHPKEGDTDEDILQKQQRSEQEKNALCSFFDGAEVPYLLEASGTPFSYHIWVFLKPVKAIKAREFGKQILKELGIKKMEVFPKQVQISRKGYGNLVKLPLATHRKNGLQSKIMVNGEWTRDFTEITVGAIDISTYEPEVKMKKVKPVTKAEGVRPIFNWAINQILEGEEGHWMRIAVVREFYNNGMTDLVELAMLFNKQDDFDLDYSIDKVKSIIKDEYGVWSWDTLMDRCGGFVEAYNASLSTHPNSDNNI